MCHIIQNLKRAAKNDKVFATCRPYRKFLPGLFDEIHRTPSLITSTMALTQQTTRRCPQPLWKGTQRPLIISRSLLQLLQRSIECGNAMPNSRRLQQASRYHHPKLHCCTLLLLQRPLRRKMSRRQPQCCRPQQPPPLCPIPPSLLRTTTTALSTTRTASRRASLRCS